MKYSMIYDWNEIIPHINFCDLSFEQAHKWSIMWSHCLTCNFEYENVIYSFLEKGFLTSGQQDPCLKR